MINKEDIMTLEQAILAQHLIAEFYTVSGENRWMGKLMSAESWKNAYGITTVEQLDAHLDAIIEKERREFDIELMYMEMNASLAEQERKDAELIAQYTEMYVKKSDLTYNPFADLHNMVTKKQ